MTQGCFVHLLGIVSPLALCPFTHGLALSHKSTSVITRSSHFLLSGHNSLLLSLLDQPVQPTEEVTRFYQSFIKNVLMPEGSNLDVLRCYANDFLRMAFPGQDLAVYEVTRVGQSTIFSWRWLWPSSCPPWPHLVVLISPPSRCSAAAPQLLGTFCLSATLRSIFDGETSRGMSRQR